MKKFFLLISILIFPVTGFVSGTPDDDKPVTGFINITVESNINRVSFSYSLGKNNITDVLTGNEENAVITVPVRDFRCNNKMAFKDFLTLLKAEQFPEISITIPGDLSARIREGAAVIHDVTVTIAGVSGKYELTCSPGRDGNIVGTMKLKLDELKIDPPEKYFGMVKIKNEVVVNFGIGIQSGSYARK